VTGERWQVLRTGSGFAAFLAELREIGWAEWDPIGLSSDRASCEDEYDSYLLAAAGKLANGRTDEQVADYLIYIETSYMGMSKAPDARRRALVTARRIAALVTAA
jgi:hypothetical protein